MPRMKGGGGEMGKCKKKKAPFTTKDAALLKDLDRRVKQIEVAFTPTGLAKGLEVAFHRQSESDSER